MVIEFLIWWFVTIREYMKIGKPRMIAYSQQSSAALKDTFNL
jgi:hypothetical protein